ncbi:ATP-binding protein [Botryobacter ruber]|uniref:ATP-binding protein n=1 Tax=Botryobacter ruber TaxID=2171629 RepID=UPI000E0AC244|nr:ATP-binding protein [Botryobacter ruber]
MSAKADSKISKKLTRLYLVALTAVALLTLGGQLLVQRSLKSQLSDSRVINIAGRQRMLSQKICKTVLLLRDHQDSQEVPVYLADLDEALELWKQCHVGLKYGYLDFMDTPVNNSDTINVMFAEIDPLFTAIFTNASIVSSYYHSNAAPAPADIQKNIDIILRNERAFLSGMNQIVFQYDAEATRRVNSSQNIEHIVMFSTLGVLIAEGLFIFRPAVNQIKYTVGKLVESEQQTQKMNEELVRVNKSLEETKEALVEATKQKYQQKIDEQKLKTAALIEGQEEERKRIALEIHDGLGQMLTALRFGIEKLDDSVHDPEAAQLRIAELRNLLGQTITEARALSYNLMPSVLNDFGISSALKLLTTQVASGTDTHVSYTTNWNGKRLPKNIEIGLYRISQEAINNALKYSKAKEITVDLSGKKKYIHLSIADNGRGFAYHKSALRTGEKGSANGISNMKERVHMINGEIEIASRPGKGTKIHVKIPAPAIDYA